MSGKRYTDEFKIEAVRQITEGGYPVQEVAARLGVTTKVFTTGRQSSASPLASTRRKRPRRMSSRSSRRI